MTLRTTKFDAADFLETPEDITAYLSAALEENDLPFFFAALGTVARSKGMTEIAEKSGKAREALYRALDVKGNPSFETISRVIGALNLQLTIKPAADGAANDGYENSYQPRQQRA